MKKLLILLSISLSLIMSPVIADAFNCKVKNQAYSRSKWNGDNICAASRNAISDKIATLSPSISPVFTTDITVQGLTGAMSCVNLTADAGEDNDDKWRYCVADGGAATLETFQSGSWVAVWTTTNSGGFTITGDFSVGSDQKINMGDGLEFNWEYESDNLHVGLHDVDGNEFFTLQDVGTTTAANLFGMLDIHRTAGSAATTSYEAHGIHMEAGSLVASSTIHGTIYDTTGTTSGEVIAIGIFPGVEVLVQHTGTFVIPDQGPGAGTYAARFPNGGSWAEGIDGETVFVADDDEIYIGSASTFSELELILTTPASKTIGQPPNDEGEYYFRNTSNVWIQFSPTDGTDGFKLDGIISWDATDFANWKSDYDPGAGNGAAGYYIKIKRTRGGSMTSPVPTTLKLLSPTNFGWDENADVTINNLASQNYRTKELPIARMQSSATNGATFGTSEKPTNDVNDTYYSFIDGTETCIETSVMMPEEWDLGTIKVKFPWSSASGSTAGDTVEWQIACRSYADGDVLDQAMGTQQVISDTLLANDGDQAQMTAATPALTCAGPPALGNRTRFKICRNISGGDNMSEQAYLHDAPVIQYRELATAVAAW